MKFTSTKLQTLAELSLMDGVQVTNEGNRFDFDENDIRASDYDDAYAKSLIWCSDYLSAKTVTWTDTYDATGYIEFTDEDRAEFHRLQQCINASNEALSAFQEPRAQCPDCKGQRTQIIGQFRDGEFQSDRCDRCDGRGDVSLDDAFLEERENEILAEDEVGA